MILAENFYLLRTPLLPLNVLKQFNAFPHLQLNEKLKDIFSDPYLQEAIYIASPELYQETQKWLQDCIADPKENDKLVLSLFRYLLRMCTRCTPYGLFAGCAIGKVDSTSHISLQSFEKHRKHCRLDMNYVAELASMITQLPEVQKQLLYYPNNSLYRIGNKYRYAESVVKNKFRTYFLTEVCWSPSLEKMICTACKGATPATIAASIVSDMISEEEANEFVKELIQNQILVSELEPTVTGEEFFTTLTKKINTLQSIESIAEKINSIHYLLQQSTNGVTGYLEAHSIVNELLPDTKSKDLVQTDLFLSTAHNSISSSVITDVQNQLEKLWVLARRDNNNDIKNFIRAFSERYEDQEIPFVLALDAEAGIGYAGYAGGNADHAALVNDIIATNENKAHTISWSKMESFQLQKLQYCIKNNKTEIEITDKDLEELKENSTSPIPDSFYVMGTLLGQNTAEIDKGSFQFALSACGGPSGANLLGRFCHGDKTLMDKVKQHLKEEEQHSPEWIYAEVVHLPEARTGNVLMRPRLRNYEIVYLGNGSVEADHQIPISDLMIKIENDTVILRSKKLNKRIIPRLTNAHNFSFGSLSVYKFLCDLQFQQLQSAIAWQWSLPNDEPFLPRVRYGKIILSKCTWTLNKKDYPELNQKKINNSVSYIQLFDQIKAQLKLPQYVVIAEGDNELFIDLNNESCLLVLVNTLIKKEKVVLQEFLNTEDKCFIEGPLGKHTNEMIIPFKKPVKINSDVPEDEHLPGFGKAENDRLNSRSGTIPQRTFITGSEWLYIKIYCGAACAERTLKEVVKPLTEKLLAENKIDEWFFIRYADPENHIRIRFHHSNDTSFWKTVLEQLYTAMNVHFTDTSVYKIQTDTYNREIGRYGVNTMEISERIFYYDSEAVLNCIDLFEGDEGEKYRWLLCARGIDMLLEDFEYDMQSKAVLLKKLRDNFFIEFGGDKALNNLLNDKYRENMQMLRSFLDKKKDEENEIEEAIALFTIRSMKIKQGLKAIKAVQGNNSTYGFAELLPSYIHMFLNRMFLSHQRKYELTIYHFLSKYYDSQVAINKQHAREHTPAAQRAFVNYDRSDRYRGPTGVQNPEECDARKV